MRWPELGVAPVAVSTRRDEGVRVDEHVQRDTARFVAARIRRNDNYQVRIAFPPKLRRRCARLAGVGTGQVGAHPRHALAGLAVFLVATLALWLYWWQRRPETQMTRPDAPPLSVPSSLPVALAAALKARSGRPRPPPPGAR